MTYQSQCSECKKIFEYQSSIADRYLTPNCCGMATERKIINPPMGYVDTPAAG